MKNFEEEIIKGAYPEAPESFHNAVTGALDSLDEKKPLKFRGRKTTIRIIAACVAAAVIGTFTITAAATDFFGFNTTKNGRYGLNVKVETSGSTEFEYQRMNLKFGYLPDSYVDNYSHPSWFDYRNGEEYFTAWVEYTDDYDQDFLNVIDSFETDYDEHKALFITFKEAENTDKLEYASFKYFDQYKCMVRCNCSDIEELKKITEKIDLEPSPEDQPAADEREGSYYSYDGAIVDYNRGDIGFRDEFLAGKVKEAKLGDSIELTTADYDEEPVKLTAKVTSVKEQDNIDGLYKKWFADLGLETTFDMFFYPDGTLVKEKTDTEYEGFDKDHLGTAKDVTYKRHFYVAEIELTAEDDIDDLHRVFTTDVFMFEGRNYYGYSTLDNERALDIYDTKNDEKLSLKKGETVTIKTGFITENDAADMTYLSISAIDASEFNYQNYMVKIKE